jgi:hypothetical protein
MFGAIPDFNQSLEMFKTMWGQNATGAPGASFMPDMSGGMSGFNGAMPTFDIEVLAEHEPQCSKVNHSDP